MAFAVFLGSNRDPGRGGGCSTPFCGRCIRCILASCTTFRRIEFYGVSRRFLAASSPLFMGVKFVRFWPLHGFLWVSDLSDLSRVPGFTPDLCGFGAGSNRFVTASRVHQLGAFLVVRSLFVGVFLGVRSGFMGRDPREFAGSSRGPASGRRAWFLGGLSRARVNKAK